VNKKFTIYTDPTYPNDKMLMGYQGDSQLDSGMVFADYEDLPVPTVIERLAGVADEEIQDRVDVPDPAVEGAVPSE
jgi:hypothetical protein